LTESDVALLDEVFERALASWEDGAALTVDELLPGRPDLAEQAERVLALAQEVAVTGPAPGPSPVVPGYTVLSELGRGAMGAVYLARQDKLGGRPVALKVLPAGAAVSARARERFRAEANAVARLRHPHIVTVYDVVREGTLLAFAMEPVEGPGLHEVIDHMASLGRPVRADDVRAFLGVGSSALGEVPYWTVIARIGAAVARALEAVHGAGLLHRDVKPSNILLRRDGTPLLSDFGLVRDPESGVVTREGFVGTPAYAPPEQLAGGLGAADARSDVYALGATLYHALALRAPFAGSAPGELIPSVERGAAPLRSRGVNVPRDLETIIGKAMAPSARERYATAGDLAADLERLLAERPILARPGGALVRAVKLLRRNRQAFWGTVVGAIGVLVLVGGITFGAVLMPRWAQEARERAWLALLDPRDTANFANAALFEYRRQGPPEMNRTVLARALAEYDAAARWQPWDERTVLERDALAAMHSLGPGVRARFTAELLRRAPKACGWLEQWVSVAPDADVPALPTGAMSRDDLIAVGMMSYVSSEMMPAVEAWQRLEQGVDPGPFVRGGLGLYFTYKQEFGRAYPRLAHADRAFRDVSFLRAAHAEAAWGVGDIDMAAKLLDEARRLSRRDEGQVFRVGTLISLARGDDDAAIERFKAWFFASPQRHNTVAGYQVGTWLAAHGKETRGLGVLAIATGNLPPKPIISVLMPLAERWWDSQSEAERLELVERAIATGVRPEPWGDTVVPVAYWSACHRLASSPQFTDLRRFLRGHSLEGVGRRLERYSRLTESDMRARPPLPTGDELRRCAREVLGLDTQPAR